MVALQPGSPHYNRVETEFKKTLKGKTIHKIERVQIIDLWESQGMCILCDIFEFIRSSNSTTLSHWHSVND